MRREPRAPHLGTARAFASSYSSVLLTIGRPKNLLNGSMPISAKLFRGTRPTILWYAVSCRAYFTSSSDAIGPPTRVWRLRSSSKRRSNERRSSSAISTKMSATEVTGRAARRGTSNRDPASRRCLVRRARRIQSPVRRTPPPSRPRAFPAPERITIKKRKKWKGVLTGHTPRRRARRASPETWGCIAGTIRLGGLQHASPFWVSWDGAHALWPRR